MAYYVFFVIPHSKWKGIIMFNVWAVRIQEFWSSVYLVGFLRVTAYWRGFPGDEVLKNLPARAGDARDIGSIPGWEDSLV